MPQKRKYNLKNLGASLKTKKALNESQTPPETSSVLTGSPERLRISSVGALGHKTSIFATSSQEYSLVEADGRHDAETTPQSCHVDGGMIFFPEHDSTTTAQDQASVVNNDDDSIWEDWDDDGDPGPGEAHDAVEEPDDGETTLTSEAHSLARTRQFGFPPSLEEVRAAHQDLQNLLKPPRRAGRGYRDPGFERVIRERLEAMRLFCFNFLDLSEKHPGSAMWQSASTLTAKSLGYGGYKAKNLRKWTREFITNRDFIPVHCWKGKAGKSLIDDEDFAQELHLHLQSIGKFVSAQDLVNYTARPDILERYGRERPIALATAQRWMLKMGYRWKKTPRGQYVDGHERDDVVKYRNEVFLPAMAELESKMRKWPSAESEGDEIDPSERRTVVWYHDESTYYENDRRLVRWVHKLEKADGKETAQKLLRAGKGREG